MAIKFLNNIKDSYNEVFNFDQNDFRIEGKHINAEFGVWARSYGSVRQMGLDGGASFMGLFTSGTEKVRITSDGNVGIGTTSPSAKLQIGNGSAEDTLFHSYGLYNEVKFYGVNNQTANGVWEFINDGTWNQTRFYVEDANNLGSRLTFRFTGNKGANEILAGTSTGNVGIGTTSPNFKLDVAGVINTTAHYKTDSNLLLAIYQSSWAEGQKDHYVLYNAWTSGTGDYLLVKGSGNQSAGNGAMLIADGNGGRVFFGRHSNEAGAADSSTSPLDETYAFVGATDTYFSSNVGIGTNSPDLKLHLAHSDGNNGLLLEHTSQASGFQILQNIRETEGLIWQRWTNGVFASNLMTLDYTGNLGLGTTDPEVRLHVKANSNVGRFTSAVNSVPVSFYHTGGSVSTVGFKGSTSTSDYHVRIGADGNDFIAYTNNNEKLRITSTGNVGIGTTNPVYKLDVATNNARIGGDSAHSAQLFIQANSGVDIGFHSNAILNLRGQFGRGKGVFYGDETISGQWYSGVPNDGTHTGWHVGYSPTYYAEDLDKSLFYISSAGNVGIGTTSPSAKLEINVAGATNQLLLTQGSTDHMALLAGTGGAGIIVEDNNFFAIWHQDYANRGGETGMTERMRINASGNVGIGTTSPAQKLDVVGRVRASYDANNYYEIGASSSGGFVVGKNGGTETVNIRTYGDSHFTGGNFGIGSTSPVGKLEVNTGSSAAYFTRTAGDDGLLNPVVAIAADSTRGLIAASGDSMSFRVRSVGTSNPLGGNTVMSLLPNGNVGIGTTSPSEKLHVAGNVKVNGSISVTNIVTNKLVKFNGNILDDSTIYDNGNIGIGTTSPQSLLHVAKAGNRNGGSMLIGETGSGTSKWSYLAGSHYNQSTGSGNGSGSAGVALIGSLAAETYNRVYIGGGPYEINPATEIQFWTHTATTHTLGGSVKMSVNSSGNLRLHTYGAGILKTDTNGNVSLDTSTYLTSYTETQTLDDVTTLGNSTSNAIIVGRVEAMNGGTDSGQSSTTVKIGKSTSTAKSVLIHNETGDAHTWFNYSDGSNYITADTSNTAGHTIFRRYNGTSYLEDMRISSSGNVGIGTTSPTVNLQVGNNASTTTSLFNQYTGTAMILNSRYDTADRFGSPLLAFTRGTGTLPVIGGISLTSNALYITTNGGDDLSLNSSGSVVITTGVSENILLNPGTNGNVGIGTTSPVTKLDVVGSIRAGGKTTYTKAYASLDTTGNAVAGLVSSFNGASAMFTFVCYGHTGGYQKIVYSCWNTSGTSWNVAKVIDEGTGDFDVTVDPLSATRTFTFKSTSGTKSYSPRVVVEHNGAALDSQYL